MRMHSVATPFVAQLVEVRALDLGTCLRETVAAGARKASLVMSGIDGSWKSPYELLGDVEAQRHIDVG